MAKIRTIEALDDLLSEETAWRMQELTTARKLVQQSEGTVKVAALRSGVLILYAHWEGWIKNTSRLYIRYVNTQRYSLNELSAAFLGNAIKTRIIASADATQSSTHNEFALFIQENLNDRVVLSEDLVRTESNLSSLVLEDILSRLGLPILNIYQSRAHLIDEKMVSRRNSIAHGKYLQLQHEEFLDLHSSILELLQTFTDQIRNAASTDAHLLQKQPAST